MVPYKTAGFPRTQGNLRDFELLFAPIQNMGVDHRRTQMYPNPWKDYNYKSLAAVAHTPGWNGTPVAGNRELDLSRRLRIGCVFRSRNVTFCCVLHTQLIEIIDFVRFEAQNLFSFLARVGRVVLFTDF